MHRTSVTVIVVAILAIVGLPAAAHAVVFGQLDDFENGTVMDWRHANFSPTNPVNVPDGGPGGAGDGFLRNNSLGGSGAHSRQVIFNQSQWLGDYNAAGVTRVTGFMINLGSTPLFMRVAIEGAGSQFSSTTAIPLPAGSGWQPVTFDLTPSRMTSVAGTQPLNVVLNGVNTLRILSAQAGPAWRGDTMVSTIGIDHLRATRLPGDANFDGLVNLDDFNALAANFGAQSGATWQQGDFTFNGAVNLEDFNELAANFGQAISGPGVAPRDWAALAAVVPEPAMAGAALLLTAAMAFGRPSHVQRVRLSSL